MDHARLVAAMAEKCKGVILSSENADVEMPDALRPKHLLWMCDRIQRHAEDWPDTKLHRWIGFVQCGMMANRMLSLHGIKRIFDDLKKADDQSGEDQDLLDHLDPDSSFEFDIGGQG